MGNSELREGLGGRVRVVSGNIRKFDCNDVGECAIGISEKDGTVFNGTISIQGDRPNIVGFEATGIASVFGNRIFELNAEASETALAAD